MENATEASSSYDTRVYLCRYLKIVRVYPGTGYSNGKKEQVSSQNYRIDMSYLFGLCNFTKLSNIYRHDLSKVLKHPIRSDRLINLTFKKQ